jgi:transposase
VFWARQPRSHVYQFPTAAPELNPTELVWTQLKEYAANAAPHNMTELRANVRAGVKRTRHWSQRLWTCIFASGLPWKR